MNILFLLVALSFFMALLFLLGFFWAHKTGQHKDLYTPSLRILLEDEPLEND